MTHMETHPSHAPHDSQTGYSTCPRSRSEQRTEATLEPGADVPRSGARCPQWGRDRRRPWRLSLREAWPSTACHRPTGFGGVPSDQGSKDHGLLSVPGTPTSPQGPQPKPASLPLLKDGDPPPLGRATSGRCYPTTPCEAWAPTCPRACSRAPPPCTKAAEDAHGTDRCPGPPHHHQNMQLLS